MLRSLVRALRARLGTALTAVSAPSDEGDATRSRYRRAVSALPARQREIFRLHRIDGLTLAEIAQRLDMPSSDVEREFAAALLAIARTVEPRF